MPQLMLIIIIIFNFYIYICCQCECWITHGRTCVLCGSNGGDCLNSSQGIHHETIPSAWHQTVNGVVGLARIVHRDVLD